MNILLAVDDSPAAAQAGEREVQAAHNGAVITLLAICKLKHRQSYLLGTLLGSF